MNQSTTMEALVFGSRTSSDEHRSLGFIKMSKAFVILMAIFFSQYSLADCIDIKGTHYCGVGECIEFEGMAYCAKNKFGKVVIYKNAVYCGSGNCLERDGNMYCSQFPGGGIIEHDKALWTGPGECIIHGHSAYCAKKPRGKCFIIDDAVNCEGGWVKEIPQIADRCTMTTTIN